MYVHPPNFSPSLLSLFMVILESPNAKNYFIDNDHEPTKVMGILKSHSDKDKIIDFAILYYYTLAILYSST